MRRSLGGAWLAAVVFLLPFEPRRPTLELAGSQVTFLEAAAGLAILALLWQGRDRLGSLIRRPSPPLLFLTLFAAAHFLSAALAPTHSDLAFKFALRMAAMAAFAWAVALAPPLASAEGLLGLAVGGGVVAALAVSEGLGVRSLDPFLDHFREMPFNVGGSRRASAGSEYPNLAAAFLAAALVVVAGMAARRPRPLRLVLPACGLIAWGLLFTYSRGALVAATLGLICLLTVAWRVGWPRATAPLASLLVLIAVFVGFMARGEIFRLRLESEGTTSWYGAIYQPSETALTLAPDEIRVTAVRVTNAGLRTWSGRENFNLSYHWYDAGRRYLSDGGRTALPHDVAPGETVLLQAELRAPRAEGRYVLVWDMVHEHTSWFSGQGVQPAVVPSVVAKPGRALGEAPRATEPLTPLAWRPGRAELWRLALGLWWERPWTGAGPDNFRWLYGLRAGHAIWDDRVFANNTLLEAAATTGTLGLLALAACLVSSVLTAARLAVAGAVDRETAPATLLALTVVLVAHGVVDYVLAFTGHYLFFGFVVGAISARAVAPGPFKQ